MPLGGLLGAVGGTISGLFGDRGESERRWAPSPVPPQYQAASTAASDVIQRGLAGGYPAYPGALTAGPSPLQEQGFGAVGELYPTIAGQMGATAGGEFLSPETNPYLAETYAAASAPLLKQWREQIMPGINTAAEQAGAFYSTGRSDWLGSRGLDLADQLAALSAGIYGPAYQAERGLQTQAQRDLANLPGMLLDAGGTQRTISQEDINRLYQEWLRTQPQSTLGQATSFLGTQPGAVQVSGTDVSGQNLSGLPALGTQIGDILDPTNWPQGVI